MCSTNQLVRELKANQEDFEFYPTTHIIIEQVKNDLEQKGYFRHHRVSFLEVGAGDCRVTNALSQSDVYSFCSKFVIEKAIVHIKNLPNNVTLVGTEFFETNLSSIESDIIFCNPPYGQYEAWASQIISTCFASVVYLVIPERWQNSQTIKQALKFRGMTTEVIYSGDFLEADRKARAKVDVVRIIPNGNKMSEEMRVAYRRNAEFYVGNCLDPMEQLLSGFDKQEDYYSKSADEAAEKEKLQELILKGGTILDMVGFYNRDLDRLKQDFDAICSISPKSLKIIGVSRETLVKAIKHEMSKLKHLYWEEFLKCYEPINSRLTKRSRNSLYKSILSSAYSIDFTASNCYSMTVIAIERANTFTDEQIKDLFLTHADEENLTCYKSNQKVLQKQRFRYTHNRYGGKEDVIQGYSHCKLEYRLVCDYNYSESWRGGADISVMKDVVNDYKVIARTLGMNIDGICPDGYFEVGKKITYLYTKNGKEVALFDIRFFKKGTYHIRLSQEFALRLNVAIGKLYGWVKSAEEAAEELNEDLQQVSEAFAQTTHIAINYANFMGIGYQASEDTVQEDSEPSTAEKSTKAAKQESQFELELSEKAVA